MITLHHLQHSRSQRLLWLLEELGLSYELKLYDRDPRTRLAPAALKALHPLGKAPVLTDGDVTVAESGTIVEYLIQRYAPDNWKPEPGSEAWRLDRFGIHFAEGSLMPQLVMGLLLSSAVKATPAIFRPIVKGVESGVQKQYLRPTLRAQLAYLEQLLGTSDWFTGDHPAAADVMLSFPLEALKSRNMLGSYPRLLAWVERVHARPAYQASLKKGGPYDYAKPAA